MEHPLSRWVAVYASTFATLALLGSGCRTAKTSTVNDDATAALTDHAYDAEAEEAASRKAVGTWVYGHLQAPPSSWPKFSPAVWHSNPLISFEIKYRPNGDIVARFIGPAHYDINYGIYTKFERSGRGLNFRYGNWSRSLAWQGPLYISDSYLPASITKPTRQQQLKADDLRYIDMAAWTEELVKFNPDAAYLKTIFQRKLKQQELRDKVAALMAQPGIVLSGEPLAGKNLSDSVRYVQTLPVDIDNIGKNGEDLLVANSPNDGLYRVKVMPDLSLALSFASNRSSLKWAFAYGFDDTKLVAPFEEGVNKPCCIFLTNHQQWKINNTHKFNKGWSVIKQVMNDCTIANASRQDKQDTSYFDALLASIDENLASVIKPNEPDTVPLSVDPEPARVAEDAPDAATDDAMGEDSTAAESQDVPDSSSSASDGRSQDVAPDTATGEAARGGR